MTIAPFISYQLVVRPETCSGPQLMLRRCHPPLGADILYSSEDSRIERRRARRQAGVQLPSATQSSRRGMTGADKQVPSCAHRDLGLLCWRTWLSYVGVDRERYRDKVQFQGVSRRKAPSKSRNPELDPEASLKLSPAGFKLRQRRPINKSKADNAYSGYNCGPK